MNHSGLVDSARPKARSSAVAGKHGRARGRPSGPGDVTTGRIPFVVTIIGLMGCGLGLTLLLSTRSAEVSYQLATAQEHNQQLVNERAVLQRQVEKADSAPELAAAAARLGMVPARDPARLVVGVDGSVTVIGKPKPAAGAPEPLLNPPSVPSNTPPVSGPMQFLFQPWTVSSPQQGAAPIPNIDVRAQGEQIVPVPLPERVTFNGGR